MPLRIEGCTFDTPSLNAVSTPESIFERFPKLSYDSKEFIEECKSGSKHLSCRMDDRVLYVGQCELATISPLLNPMRIKYVGSDDATTCHIVVLRHKTSGTVSVAHLDGTTTSAAYLEMVTDIRTVLQRVNMQLPCGANQNVDAMTCDLELDMFIFGGFRDDRKCSEKLLREILLTCMRHEVCVDLKLACCLDINTTSDGQYKRPVIYGIAVDLLTGNIFSAHHAYKGPDQVLRHARIIGHGGRTVLKICNVETGKLVLCPFNYYAVPYAEQLLALPDDLYLQYTSTSPQCEPDSFVHESKQAVRFIMNNPSSSRFFTNGSRVFSMNARGEWILDT